MKCPKCEYLGFETGDRCRNCGYDFSLMLAPDALPDLDLRAPGQGTADSESWPLELGRDWSLHSPADEAAASVSAPTPAAEPPLPAFAATAERTSPAQPAPARITPSSLPLFSAGGDDDAPLVKLPTAPRAPLAVRRTPENPRLRGLARAVPKEAEPVLQFEEPVVQETPIPQPERVDRQPVAGGLSGPSARVIAAVLDNLILGAVDITVLYFTLKVAAVSSADWQQIPLVPMAAFLLLLKLLYFSAFTAMGGQTIGKMGSGIRVVADDGVALPPTRAVRRSLALLGTLGAGFLPAVLGDDRRAIHDRVAGTRVVIA